jgi:HK97 family phage prohead protease
MNLHTINFKSVNDELKLSGYASVFSKVDRHNDIIIKGAFLKSISKHYNGQQVKLLWQHDHTKPIGLINDLFEDETGLYVKASVSNSIIQGREAINLIKQKAIDSLSIGFNIDRSLINKHGQREILEISLWEVSVVTFPANSDAKIRQLNSVNPMGNLEKILSIAADSIFKL